MLLFDTLIGNTDRHQDNWGLLWTQGYNHVRMAPVFDNGTSLGYEILESKMNHFSNPIRMQTYIDKGNHHMRWQLIDKCQCQHLMLLKQLLNRHPELKNRIKNKLALFQREHLKAMMTLCTQYPVDIPLSQERAKFVYELVVARFKAISNKITSL